MATLISVLIILASVLLVVIIFAQNPKGGGLSSDFGAATQLGGVQKTNDMVDKATWGLAGIIGVLSVILTVYLTPKKQVFQQQEMNNTEMPAGQSDLPTEVE